MFYNVLKSKDLVNSDTTKTDKKVLLENNESSLTIISLKKDELIDTHSSTTDAAAYVIDGEIEIHFEAEKFTLREKELVMFKKNDEHKVLAKKDSKFIVIKI